MDPLQPGEGSALLEVSEAVKQSGQYNMWSAQAKAVLDDTVKVKVCASRLLHCPQAKHAHVLHLSSVPTLLIQAPDVPNPRATITLPAVPVPHTGTSYNPPEAAHTALLRAAHEAELRRVQEAEALEATKARFISARHSDGDGGSVGAQGMLIDKPGEGKEEDSAPTEQSQGGLEQHDSADESVNAATKKNSALQRKTKQQRRKAEKLRAEVRGSTPSVPHLLTSDNNTRNMRFWSAPCANGCTRLSTPSKPCARPLTGRKRHGSRRPRNGVPSRKRSLRRMVSQDRNLASTSCARGKWTCSSARNSQRVCEGSRCVLFSTLSSFPPYNG